MRQPCLPQTSSDLTYLNAASKEVTFQMKGNKPDSNNHFIVLRVF